MEIFLGSYKSYSKNLLPTSSGCHSESLTFVFLISTPLSRTQTGFIKKPLGQKTKIFRKQKREEQGKVDIFPQVF